MDYSWRFDVDSALCVGLPRWILPMLLGKEFFEEKNWTVGKNIFYYVLLLLLMATGNYLSLMNQNPSVNGHKYGGNIMVALEKAKKRDPDNPRAIILSAVYHKNMAAFMNQKYEEYDKEVAHAKELLLKQDSMKCAPVWGMNVCH